MNKYKCKCGNEKDFFIEHNLSQCGLYCGECGKWQKWLNKDEERLFKHKQNLAEHDQQIIENVVDKIYDLVTSQMIRHNTPLDFNINTQEKILDLRDKLIKSEG